MKPLIVKPLTNKQLDLILNSPTEREEIEFNDCDNEHIGMIDGDFDTDLSALDSEHERSE